MVTLVLDPELLGIFSTAMDFAGMGHGDDGVILGMDDQDIGKVATATAAGLGVANTIVSETTTLLDSVTSYVIILLVILFVFGAVWWAAGKWREYDAEKKRLQAEIDARQVLY